MKSKITRIAGVALSLVMVCSMGVALLPAGTPGGAGTAEAADLSWSSIGIPSATGSVLVTAAKDLGPVAISPNYANDKTVWASVVDVTTPATPTVFKSTNGGFTWTETTSVLGAAAGDYVVDLVASPDYANDNTVFAVTQTNGGGVNTGRVYRSINGGSSFGQLGVVTMAANEVVTSFDVSPDYDGTGILAVGVADVRTATRATAANALQTWGTNGVLSWSSITAGVATDVCALTFSPNYSIDSTILVVAQYTGSATNNPYLRAIVGGVWDNGIAATQINGAAATGVVIDFADAANAVGTEILEADIAVPSDYNGQVSTTRRAYVTIVSNGGGATNVGNVYRITNVTAGTDITPSLTAEQFSNIEYRGTFAEGTLLAGLWAAAATAPDVYRTTNPTDSVVNWYGVSGAANQPSGTAGATANTTAFIAASPDYVNDSTVVVGTMGDDSAFGISLDGAASFNERGLIDDGAGALGTVSDIELSPNYATDKTIFMVTENDSAAATDTNVNVWKSSDGGTLWERCFTANFVTAGTGVISTSAEYASDSTVYVGDTGGTGVYYSANGGQSWSARAVAAGLGVTIATMAAPDATTLYVGDLAGAGNVAKSTNSGWTWPSTLNKNSGATPPVVSLKVKDSTVIVGGSNGTVRRSDDGGATWAKVAGTVAAGNAIYVDFDGTTVYALDGAAGTVYRSVDSGAWQQIGTATTTGLTANPSANGIEMILAEDGTLYFAEAAGQDVRRSINPSAALPAPDATFQAFAGTPASNIVAMSVVKGSSNIIAICNAAAGVRIYTDILSAGTAGPTLVAPADGTSLTRAQTTRFTLQAMNQVTDYDVQYSTDSTFASAATVIAIVAPSVQTAAATLTEGATIYWRARASLPLRSPWSEVWTVQTQVTTVVDAPAPVYPAGDAVINIPTSPVFNWGAFKYATGYEFQMASDSGMSTLLTDLSGDSALGAITSYKYADSLDYNTTYYWRVRAVQGSATAYSDWSATVGFTTMAEPAAATPPVVIGPSGEAEPSVTPAYIWAIIAIGAVLVVTVIVLIVRTRRV